MVFNTTFLLCYLLLNLAFFPTLLAKSMYSPVSGLKVMRRPSGSDKNENYDENDDDASALAQQPYRAGLTMTTTISPGPIPIPAPPLLEALNQNALAVFLLVHLVSLSLPTLLSCLL